MNKLRIGVALTCHNRRDKTLRSLECLYHAAGGLVNTVEMHVVVTDDGSTDGTARALHDTFPDVEVIAGNGDLYWAGGMRLALSRLYALDLDHYLWLNDDTDLLPDALARLVSTHASLQQATGRQGIVVGTTRDDCGRVTYGGWARRPRSWGALRFRRVVADTTPLPCEAINGNVVLVSAGAAAILGNLGMPFRHAMADTDYGLRALAAGVPVWVMPGTAGLCSHDHTVEGSFRDVNLPLSRRWRLLTSPKGLPVESWGAICRRHCGILWPLHFAWPYVRTVCSSVLHVSRAAQR